MALFLSSDEWVKQIHTEVQQKELLCHWQKNNEQSPGIKKLSRVNLHYHSFVHQISPNVLIKTWCQFRHVLQNLETQF